MSDGPGPRLTVARTARGVWVGWPGGARFFGAEAEVAATAAGAGAEVRAPMTGRVIKVAVVEGDGVAADQALLVLQAMKMEYRLTAPRAGRVERIACAEGEMVELGAVLVTLAPAAEPAPDGEAPPGGGRTG
jgi:acetyl/propionyl-CoA carboxylase alpha subunit